MDGDGVLRQTSILVGRSEAARKIDRLFRPESVAIVGASQKGGMAADILRNVKKWGFSGQIAAVNPRYEQIDGVLCFPSLTAIPYPIDFVVIVVPSNAIPAVLDDCERARVRAIQIISSGFAEQGGEGIAKQIQLAQWAQRTGIPVVGPNCYGLLNAANRLIATPLHLHSLRAGGISAVLQSGMFIFSLILPLLARGIGVGRVVTTGNEACTDVADFIDYLVSDEETRVIACYSEQFKRPLEFIRACERAADNNKPIVMIKVGRSEGALDGALAHTGSLAGSDVAIDAVLKKLGVIRVDTADDLIETAAALSTTKRPRGRRVAFASLSGSAANVLSDVAEPYGIEFPPLPPEVKTRLEAIFPEFGKVSNPLDVTAQAEYDTRILDESLEALATCGAYDVVIWGRGVPSCLDMRSAVGQALKRAANAAPEVVFPVMSIAGGHFFANPGPQGTIVEPQLDFDGMPLLQGVGTGLRAISALIAHAEFLRTRKPGNLLSAQRDRRSPCFAEAVRIIRDAKSDNLTSREGKRLLALYGIPVTPEKLATAVEPVEIVHTTDARAVVPAVFSGQGAEGALEQVASSLRPRRPKVEIGGVSPQETTGPGMEMMLRATFDPQFGPIVAFGLGGIWAELKDVRVLLPPFDAGDVHTELNQLRTASVLRGAQSGLKADLEGLSDCVVRFGILCTDLADEIEDIWINPVVLADNGAVTATACLITRKMPTES